MDDDREFYLPPNIHACIVQYSKLENVHTATVAVILSDLSRCSNQSHRSQTDGNTPLHPLRSELVLDVSKAIWLALVYHKWDAQM